METLESLKEKIVEINKLYSAAIEKINGRYNLYDEDFFFLEHIEKLYKDLVK